MTYIPKPVDTTKIILNEDLEGLVDYLAKNTHENWATVRIQKGWRYGPKRNDAKKEHPCLVPYERLPESEKDHDSYIAKELIKTILLLGYQIKKET